MKPAAVVQSAMLRATQSEHGVAVKFTNGRSLNAFKRLFYKIRAEAAETSPVRSLSLSGSRHDPMALWILKEHE